MVQSRDHLSSVFGFCREARGTESLQNGYQFINITIHIIRIIFAAYNCIIV